MKKTKSRFSRLLRYPAWKQSGTILVKWEGMESKKWMKRVRKAKREK